jgi:hypothetical protein
LATTIDLHQSNLRLRSGHAIFGWPIRSIQSSPLARPTLGKKQPQRQHDWGVPRAHVSDTRVWQFAILPSAEAYWEATPTECMPFLGIAVSSITGTASLPPTNEPPIVGLQCDFCFGSPEIVDWATPRFLTFKQEIEAG